MSTEAYSLNIWYASGDLSYPENIGIGFGILSLYAPEPDI
jgi:hypothetical protein